MADVGTLQARAKKAIKVFASLSKVCESRQNSACLGIIFSSEGTSATLMANRALAELKVLKPLIGTPEEI